MADTYSIAANADDGYIESGGAFNPTAENLRVGRLNDQDQTTWLRFDNIAAAKGATLTDAHITFKGAWANTATVCNLRIYGVDEDDYAAPGNKAAVDADYAARTTAYVDWSGLASWAANGTYETPDFHSILEEIFARDGWATGQAVGLLICNNGSSASTVRNGAAYENTSYTEPILSLTLAGGGPTPKTDHNLLHVGQ